MAADCLVASDILYATQPTHLRKGTYQFFKEPIMDLPAVRQCEYKAKEELRSRIASFFGENPGSVFLFPTGMAATYNVMQLAKGMEKQPLNVCLG
ncbi:hypothetical protein DSO57_1030505 [Entomophthora muscae]|uniref:Uncharacterized protein n=1 Tax=Entomophthora muscae TaxID=34485 RepID=A0ACC2TBQ2_9FUNG|nr:hypothetical protein DSO57_1030505 [Entomophthora muscae]